MKPMWNNRNLRLLVLGQASSLVGNYTLKFALSMYILEVTGSAALFATFLSVAMVPTIVLSPFGGILADRGGPAEDHGHPGRLRGAGGAAGRPDPASGPRPGCHRRPAGGAVRVGGL